MISVNQRRDTNVAYIPERGSMWIAEAVVDGVPYIARSRNGTPNALTRVLVEAGVPDDVMRVYHEGLRGYLEWPVPQGRHTNLFGGRLDAAAERQIHPIAGIDGSGTGFAIYCGLSLPRYFKLPGAEAHKSPFWMMLYRCPGVWR